MLDIGCARGLVSFQFATAGASLVHGCDHFDPALAVAREVFAELPVESRFEHVDLTGGGTALERTFGADYRPHYDVVLLLAVYHKLRRVMAEEKLVALVRHLAERTGRYLCYRGPDSDGLELDAILSNAGLRKVQHSELSLAVPGQAAIWMR